jgi:DNA-binding NtrC family response regulator
VARNGATAAVQVLPPSLVEHKDGAANGNGVALRTLEEIEREAIIGALQKFSGHRQKTARALGIGVRTLGLKLKKWKELHLVAETL